MVAIKFDGNVYNNLRASFKKVLQYFLFNSLLKLRNVFKNNVEA